jgi:murein DD-endopeptidase MepM/ murein hydrolase activator NlpD
MKTTLSFLIAMLFLSPSAYAAADIKLTTPVKCTLGEDCWIANYMDTEAAENVHKDFTCSGLTTENHEGTDFAIRNRTQMNEGVDVIAAHDGKIARVRDGEEDNIKADEELAAIREANLNCGNGILIDHGMGRSTFYCHLKKGSITAKVGDQVKRGQKIAQIGQSGDAQYPHLRFSYIWEGAHIDPFTGQNMGAGCDAQQNPIWKTPITYDPYPVFDSGFANTLPDFQDLRENGHKEMKIKSTDKTLVYWIGFFHAIEGDTLEMKITDPEGKSFSWRNVTFDKTRMLPNFYYTGRKLEGETLKSGTYKGQATFKRANYPAKIFNSEITVTAD